MVNLFSPLKIKDIEFKNRIVVSPMCQYSSEDGFANDWHLVHLGSRAVGGAGLIISEACAVSPEGRISPFDLGIWKDDHIGFLKRVTLFIEKQGSIPGIQLAHAGRKASKTRPWEGDKYIPEKDGGWQTLAPSPIPFDPEDQEPIEMSHSDIQKVIENYRKAVSRALEAGFKVLEIHAAHGYLINEFLSPLTNKRTDEYGGKFENRIRLLLEIVKEVKKVWPEKYPLFMRLSAIDWHEEGWQLQDSVRVAIELKNSGVDLIDCSSGGNIKNAKIQSGPGYQVNFASTIKRESGILTGAVGLIHSADQANEIIMTGKADLVLLAREFLRDPYFPLTAARLLNIDVKWPLQYERAKKRH
jgi:2,4-dienoyl-CoA reductase-like NADH-dependent reductase (Old Yellow Enzyme family)